MNNKIVNIFVFRNYNKKIASLEYVNNVLKKKYGDEYFSYKNKFGKPCINKKYYVSISHTKEILAIAISCIDVGIDIEKDVVLNDVLCNSFISKKDSLRYTPIESWVIKESFLKLLGVGLFIEPKKVTIRNNHIAYNDLLGLYLIHRVYNHIFAVTTYNLNVKLRIEECESDC